MARLTYMCDKHIHLAAALGFGTTAAQDGEHQSLQQIAKMIFLVLRPVLRILQQLQNFLS